MKEQKIITKEIMIRNNAMEKLIISWGLPECLESNRNNIIFKFDDEGLANTNEKGYHNKDGDIKFCLYDKKLGKVLFSMDFFKRKSKMQKLYMENKFAMILELLYVHEESLRKKGVASYYINRLREYAINENMDCIQVYANVNAKNFKRDKKVNALDQKALEAFYRNRSTPEMPIELI